MKGTVHILLNKDRYIEFIHPGNEIERRHFRFLVPLHQLEGTKRNESFPGLFAGPKSSLPIVKRALVVRGYEVQVKEDWI